MPCTKRSVPHILLCTCLCNLLFFGTVTITAQKSTPLPLCPANVLPQGTIMVSPKSGYYKVNLDLFFE